MGKKKPQPQQQSNFRELVAQQTLKKFKPYIDQLVNDGMSRMSAQQKDLIQQLFIRCTLLEELLIEKFEDVTKESITNNVANKEDESVGLTEVGDVVENGDRTRFEISTKSADQEEFQGSSRMYIDFIGSNQTLGPELEGAIIGMKVGETKEIAFGKDGKMVAKVTVNKTARRPKPEVKEEVKEETDASVDARQ